MISSDGILIQKVAIFAGFRLRYSHIVFRVFYD